VLNQSGTEKDTELAQMLGQLQPFMAAFPPECMDEIASFACSFWATCNFWANLQLLGRPKTFLARSNELNHSADGSALLRAAGVALLGLLIRHTTRHIKSPMLI
jgi:hypothetical protein